MTIRVPSDEDIWREAMDLIVSKMGPAKAARVISAMRLGGGDYMALRDELFAGQSVDSLVQRIRERRKAKEDDEGPQQ